ncbi:MAG TPA: DUF4142 domain-containing protein [Gemmatimonadales bacterium]|nr:DUF4142 domain-containing protein [Gemmatimonadales bacterium]
MRWILLPAAAAALLASCGPAGSRPEGGADTETGMATDTSTADVSATGGDRAGTLDASRILSQLATANRNEMQQAEQATRKATTPTVNEFAKRLAMDHRQSLGRAQALARELGVTMPAAGGAATEEQSASMGELSGKTGKAFDRAFIEHQIEVHQRNIDRIRNELLPAADDPKVRDYLQQTAAAMEGHLASAKQLKQDLDAG